MLTVAYGEATLDRGNVYRWYKMFSEGREDVNDEERAGRPSTSTTDEKINEVEKMILANRRIIVREVSEDLNISIGSCHSIFINDLGMRRVAAKFVPKLLNCDQKQHRMIIANEMLDSVRDDPNLLQRVITGDEAWVYGYDVEPKLNHLNGSFRTNQDRKKRAKFGRIVYKGPEIRQRELFSERRRYTCGNPITHPLPRLPNTFHIGITTEPVKVDRITEDSSMQRMTEVEDEYFADALTNMQPHYEDLVGRLTDAIRGLAVPRVEEALISSFDGSHATSSLLQYSHLLRSTPASISHFKVPHELSERQQERRLVTCEGLLARHEKKSFLHRIITSDEKSIHFSNPMRQKSWGLLGRFPKQTPRPNRFGKKAMLCIWWDQTGVVYFELLKPGKMVNTSRYEQQMHSLREALNEKRPEWREKHNNLILQHDNAPAHNATVVKNTIKDLGWELLPHPPYSPDLAPSDYHLFTSLGHALKNQEFSNSDILRKWLVDWFGSKGIEFFRQGIRKFPERWSECIANQGNYFE
ncbi:hypothetical protein LAZ67_1004379 [Cordylochernes scorpioides]|uniref:Transposase n=1 Tax=Cordylochernes scorpioides TaxID=51811 RepID=A0ABY6JYB2_9ARAC|nr:hypothetical protein LAZ67_1004379 [Cordylochernes scorpioides]